LWKSDWIANKKLTTALDVTKIITNSVEDINEVVQPEEENLMASLASEGKVMFFSCPEVSINTDAS
jgi:hypothetical protein